MKTFHSKEEVEKEYFPTEYAEKQYIIGFIPKGKENAISYTMLEIKVIFSPHTLKTRHNLKDILKKLLDDHEIFSETRREEIMKNCILDKTYYWK